MTKEDELLAKLEALQASQDNFYNEWKKQVAYEMEQVEKMRQRSRDAIEESRKKVKSASRKSNVLLILAFGLLLFTFFRYHLPFFRYGYNGYDFSYLEGQKHYEAREWLKDNKNPSPLASNRFGEKKNATAFVDKLYEAGAEAVYVVNVNDTPETLQEESGPYTDCLVVVLPEEKEKRKVLFEISNAEAQREGFEGEQDRGQKELFFWWD